MANRFDAIIIGTGQAGPALGARLAAQGMKVAVIERARFGGTCVNTGCIPTKALIASAYAAHLARRAAEYGVALSGPVAVDMKRVKQRKEEIARASREGVERWMRALENGKVIEGHARFESPTSVRAGDVILQAERIFINVGARAAVPPIPGIADVPFHTNSTMMEIDFIPEHLVIVGGSYVGLEFAQMYRRFGSRVTVVEKGPRLIGREDLDISVTVQCILEDKGIDVRLNAECISARKVGQHEIEVRLDCVEPLRTVRGSHLLLAVGRTPNTDDLGLANAGVAQDERGYIVVDDELCTNVPGIYALGDCNGRGAFTHTSYNDYEIVADNLLEGAKRRVSDRVATYALFIDPPLGRVGMTESEAKASSRDALVGIRPCRVSRAQSARARPTAS